MMGKVGKTLKQWGAKKGDVFYYDKVFCKGVNRVFDRFCDNYARCSKGKTMVDDEYWHLVLRATPEAPQPDYNDGEWHGWNGGECPVHPKSVVVVKWKIGSEGTWSAGYLSSSEWGKIVAFRVLEKYVEPKEPREFWVFTNGHGDLCVSGTYRRGGIHVKESVE